MVCTSALAELASVSSMSRVNTSSSSSRRRHHGGGGGDACCTQ